MFWGRLLKKELSKGFHESFILKRKFLHKFCIFTPEARLICIFLWMKRHAWLLYDRLLYKPSRTAHSEVGLQKKLGITHYLNLINDEVWLNDGGIFNFFGREEERSLPRLCERWPGSITRLIPTSAIPWGDQSSQSDCYFKKRGMKKLFGMLLFIYYISFSLLFHVFCFTKPCSQWISSQETLRLNKQ